MSQNRRYNIPLAFRVCLATVLLLAAWCAQSAFGLDSSSADSLAASVVLQLGRAKGVVAVPNCGNGQLARAFLQNTGMKVYASDPVQANVDAARQLVEPSGQVGLMVYAEKQSLAVIPFADRFLDAIVITNLTDADLASVSYDEVERALAPEGMAWVGRATSEGAGVTQAALQSWIDAATRNHSTAVVSTDGGTWALVTRKELDGVDTWPRHHHDASATRYSQDSVAAFPWLPQIKMKPYRWDQGTMVTSGGRMYTAFPDLNTNLSSPWLRAYSVYNGELLWSRDCSDGSLGAPPKPPAGLEKVPSIKKAGAPPSLTGDPLAASPHYIYLNEGNSLLQLDGKTGAVVRTQTFGLSNLTWFSTSEVTGLVYGSDGSTVVACDEATGAVAWSHSGGSPVISGNRISIGGTGYNATTGIADGLGAVTPPARPSPNGNSFGCGTPASDTASIGYTLRNMYVFGSDRKTGRGIVSHSYKTPCSTGAVVSNGFMLFPSNFCECAFFRGSKVEAPAGSFEFDRSAPADGAGRLEKGPAWNAVAAQVIPDGSDWPTYRNANSRNGSTAVTVPTSATAPGLAWNCQPRFNCVTEVARCMYDYRPEQQPTPAVVAGNRVFQAGSDGYVRCIDMATGSQKWSYATAGRIYAAPTVADGCVYVGSGDGWAYCLEAQSGRLVWRFRGAPVDRRFNLFGYLSSTWPIMTGVMVNQGKAYFAAGLQSEYGTHLYCLDGRSGAILWQNNSSGTSMVVSGRLGLTPQGYMAIAGTKLLMSSSNGPTASFDLATGVQDPIPTEFATQWLAQNGYSFSWFLAGKDIGVLDNGHLLYGGTSYFQDHRQRSGGGWQSDLLFYHMKLDATGKVLCPLIQFNNSMTTTPAWDGSEIFATTLATGNLSRFTIAEYSSKIDAGVAADAGNLKNANQVPANYPQASQVKNGVYTNALVLTPNALVATYTKDSFDRSMSKNPESVDWYLGAFDRTSLATLWETKMPDIPGGFKGEPLYEGLAVDRNGNIVVTQRNGNILLYGKAPNPEKPAPPAEATVAVY